MSIIRWILGRIILLIDWLTRPALPGHSAETQAKLDAQTPHLALYQYQACPFCVKTRRAIRRLGLNIEIRDAKNNANWRSQLEKEGGKIQVPCLASTEEGGSARWLYESSDINRYLEQRFGTQS